MKPLVRRVASINQMDKRKQDGFAQQEMHSDEDSHMTDTLASRRLVVIDVETTGLGQTDRIVEIAAVTLDPVTWKPVDEYETLVNPERDIGALHIHGITASMVEAAPTFSEIIAALVRRIHGATLIAHNISFDARMLGYEFDRLSVDFDAGSGLCTLKKTGRKLPAACDRYGIPLDIQHRALADARATGALAREIFFNDEPGNVAATIGDCPHILSPRTLRRDAMSDQAGEMIRVVSHAYYPYSDEALLQYLDALDWVLDDHHIDKEEHAAIEKLAATLGISDERRQEAHRAYLASIIAAVKRDGIVTGAEQRIIGQVATALGISDIAIPEVTELPAASSLHEGMCVCFTGKALDEGTSVSKSSLENFAAQAGMQPVDMVTKKNCDLLVAADVSSQSGKARKARDYGIPVMTVVDFLAQIGRDQDGGVYLQNERP